MQRQAVESSMIRSVGYDPQHQILEIEFVKSGDVYQYRDVPQPVYQDLLTATSHGQYFQAHIRGEYPYQKLPRH
ncbi:KTSC domain-containing protein [Sphaerobacter sp.]|uniref:KTSC domain-containing protein n=1 Tax=Sphaerobacter sp. TaxID=2099654 RepID=UPI001D1C90B7|nr:KTSC domain-containing protein [Sphaerobacter sp.]MBX5446724.1 KTSC domain-containing protein [Sphaerobacter sp.]